MVATSPDRRPIAFNFFNSDCPCSRFNLDHVRELAEAYGSRVRFILVVEGGTWSEQRKAFAGLGLDVEPCYDPDGEVARELGVYATPQGVVLDSERRLVYRGNYNVGRFCSDHATEFVRLALDGAVLARPIPTYTQKPSPAYGCAISAVWKKREEVQ